MKVKSMSTISSKFKNRTAVATNDYAEGVKAPRKPWAAATKAAEPNYEAGVQASISAKRFGKGVDRAGDTKWVNGATTKGVARYPAGVAAAVPDYEKGFKPYYDALSALTLSPRREKRNPANLQRVTETVNAMIATAEAQGA